MSLQRRIRRTTKQYIIVATICIIVMGGAAMVTAVMITGQIKNSYLALLTEARTEMAVNKRTVYIATTDIMAGDYVTEDKIITKSVYASQPLKTYMTSEDIGKIALINILTDTQLLNSMLSENTIASEVREIEYTVINISSNIANNDTVDVRLSYPNGESYVVLSKKTMKGYIPGTSSCYFWMLEDELLRMSAAIVDAGLYTGSTLYLTKYIEPNIQEASKVNYTPSLSVLSLLESDPNILENTAEELSSNVRKELENRLADSLSSDVTVISWELEPNKQTGNVHLTETADDVQKNSGEDQIVSETDQAQPEADQIQPGVRQTQPEDSEYENSGQELGDSQITDSYFYYVEEEEAREEDIEYGE